jgi:hypothetical protein
MTNLIQARERREAEVSEKRTRPCVGQIQQVLYFPNGKWPTGCAHRMMAMPDEPKASGQFFFNGSTVYFHESDRKIEKFIVYDSVVQVQLTTRGTNKVRLRP